ncbi:MAG TPA: hypothetical protein VMJ32_12280 [Pirellulales bacterium]|nr:hypothetical protein [Pirellulales bacterium]
MCLGVAVPIHEIPETLIVQHRLADRIAQRDPGAGREIQFLWRHRQPVLAVNLDNQLRIVKWGNRGGGPLPAGGWCHREWIEAGLWQELRPQPAIIAAALAIDRGIWTLANEGIKGVVVRDRVYMLTEPATHYYRIMTRSNRMPVLVGQTI